MKFFLVFSDFELSDLSSNSISSGPWSSNHVRDNQWSDKISSRTHSNFNESSTHGLRTGGTSEPFTASSSNRLVHAVTLLPMDGFFVIVKIMWRLLMSLKLHAFESAICWQTPNYDITAFQLCGPQFESNLRHALHVDWVFKSLPGYVGFPPFVFFPPTSKSKHLFLFPIQSVGAKCAVGCVINQ